jgi:hypothetical protein
VSTEKSSENEIMAISEKLDRLREEILKLERELSKYSFDPRRGIESYSMSEIEKLLKRAGPNYVRIKELLYELVCAQEKLYRELYSSAGLRELNVDTETPEKNLIRLKRWLLAGRDVEALPANNVTKFDQVLRGIARILRRCQDNCVDEILIALKSMYKRDYDRYRVVKHIAENCTALGGLEAAIVEKIETLPLERAVEVIVECSKKVGCVKLATYLEARGEKR